MQHRFSYLKKYNEKAGSGNTKALALVPQTDRNLWFRSAVEVLSPQPVQKNINGAGSGNRTRMVSLEG